MAQKLKSITTVNLLTVLIFYFRRRKQGLMNMRSLFSVKWVIIRSVLSLERVIIWVIIMTWLRSLLFFRAVVTLVNPLKIFSDLYSKSKCIYRGEKFGCYLMLDKLRLQFKKLWMVSDWVKNPYLYF